MNKIGKNRILGVIGLLAVGTGTRYLLISMGVQAFPNFELIMLVTFLAAIFYPQPQAFLIPLVAMTVSDLCLGNFQAVGSIMIFTYSGFALASLVSSLGKNKWKKFRLNAKSTGCGIGWGCLLTLIYDGWTNLGWWILTPFYPHTLGGLVACYGMALPFMGYHLLSSMATFGLGVPFAFWMRNYWLSLRRSNTRGFLSNETYRLCRRSIP
jgi:hypothetical protein